MRRDSFVIVLLLFVNIGFVASLNEKAKKYKSVKYDIEKELRDLLDELDQFEHYKANRNVKETSNADDIAEVDLPKQERLHPVARENIWTSLKDKVLEEKETGTAPPTPEKSDLIPESTSGGIPRQDPAKEKQTATGKKQSQSGQSSNQTQTISISKRSHRKRAMSEWPYAPGINVANIGTTLPSGGVRTGEATDTDSCSTIIRVPKSLRNSAGMYQHGIRTSFYYKYTEVYGIPIIGSANVTDEGLTRACYIIKMLLASRYDVRNAIYKIYGRIALIGDGEEQNHLIDYTHLDDSWNTRVRGVGPTLHIPISSAGDDNMRCKAFERYWDQDILVHEFSHHIEQIGATYTIPGFKERLYDIFYEQVVLSNLWGDEYATTNMHEYFATASQFYFNSFRYPGKYETYFNVYDRDSLRAYDPLITDLLDEVHPCFAYEGNSLIQRCDWKKCTIDNFELVYDESVQAMSGCDVIEDTSSIASLDACADMACYYGANVFNFRGTKCYVLNCVGTSNYQEMMLTQSGGDYNIYKIKTNMIPRMDNSLESSQSFTSHCLNGPHGTSSCNVPSADRITCGWDGIIKKWCKRIGCCWNNACFYSKQECRDYHYLCPERAKAGDCERNPGYMYRKCSLACNVCNQLDQLDENQLLGLCQDKNIYCEDWADSGECSNNPAWMTSTCQISCNACSSPADPLAGK